MPRAGLSPQRVVDEAAALADEIGFAQVTLAAVAARVGVRLPSLYKHVDGIDAIRSALTTRAADEVGVVLADATRGRHGADAVRALTSAYREWSLRHPARYAATIRAPSDTDEAALAAAARAVRVVTEVVAEFGLTGDRATDATRLIRATMHGFVALELDGGFGMPRAVEASFAQGVEVIIRGLEAR